MLSSSQRIPILEREKALMGEVKEWQEQWREEKRRHAKVEGRKYCHIYIQNAQYKNFILFTMNMCTNTCINGTAHVQHIFAYYGYLKLINIICIQ